MDSNNHTNIIDNPEHKYLYLCLVSLKSLVFFFILTLWLNLWSFNGRNSYIEDDIISIDGDVDEDFDSTLPNNKCQCQDNVCSGWDTIPVLLWTIIFHFFLDIDLIVNSDSAVWRWNIVGNTIFILSTLYCVIKLREYALHWGEQVSLESNERPRDDVIYTVPVLVLCLLLVVSIFVNDILIFFSLELTLLLILIIIVIVTIVLFPVTIYYLKAYNAYKDKKNFEKNFEKKKYNRYGTL